MGILKYNCHNGYIASIIEEEDLVSVKASAPGFLRRFVTINEEVNRGQLLGEVINPYNGEILSEIRSTQMDHILCRGSANDFGKCICISGD